MRLVRKTCDKCGEINFIDDSHTCGNVENEICTAKLLYIGEIEINNEKYDTKPIKQMTICQSNWIDNNYKAMYFEVAKSAMTAIVSKDEYYGQNSINNNFDIADSFMKELQKRLEELE